MTVMTRRLLATFLVASLGFTSSASWASGSDYYYKRPTILDTLQDTDGAQALVAAVLVVDEADTSLDFKIADLLDNKRAEIILFAPGNAAFENLLGLDEGSLNGLTIQETVDALPGLLPDGVGAKEVAAILLKHVALPNRANRYTASEDKLLAKGEIKVADGSKFPVGIGGKGVQVNYETTIIKADNFDRNGVIHYIDTVIVDDLL